jgi:hypothetical protein
MLVIAILMAALIVAGCSSRFVPSQEEVANSPLPSSSHRPTNGLVQSNTGGSVTIDVEWVKAEDDSLIFNVAMNTHSVNLDQYDPGELAVLRDDTGNEYHPISWNSAPGGHHRRGTLTFPIPDSLNQGEAKYVEIVIRDVAGIEERIFTWEL